VTCFYFFSLRPFPSLSALAGQRKLRRFYDSFSSLNAFFVGEFSAIPSGGFLVGIRPVSFIPALLKTRNLSNRILSLSRRFRYRAKCATRNESRLCLFIGAGVLETRYAASSHPFGRIIPTNFRFHRLVGRRECASNGCQLDTRRLNLKNSICISAGRVSKSTIVCELRMRRRVLMSCGAVGSGGGLQRPRNKTLMDEEEQRHGRVFALRPDENVGLIFFFETQIVVKLSSTGNHYGLH
jgi:hypothetical protein